MLILVQYTIELNQNNCGKLDTVIICNIINSDSVKGEIDKNRTQSQEQPLSLTVLVYDMAMIVK